jgi:hypothetical protein
VGREVLKADDLTFPSLRAQLSNPSLPGKNWIASSLRSSQ